MTTKFLSTLILILIFSQALSGCTVIAIADTAASAVVGVTKIAVKGTVAVVDAAIPDGDDDDEDESEDD